VTLATIPTPVPTPNVGPIRHTTDLLVWHSTAGGAARGSAEWVARPKSGAGYHYLIDRDGSIIASTPLDRIAYHAGLSAWPVPAGGIHRGSSINRRSIGVAFANRNDGTELVTPAQIDAAVRLATLLAARYPALKVVANHIRHRDCAPGRKTDPLPSALDWPAFVARLRGVL
jgi:N-acetyl-anhydromuramyl-L-alanine amidase AmpD